MATDKIVEMIRTLNQGYQTPSAVSPLAMPGRAPAGPAPLLQEQPPELLDLLLEAQSGVPGNNLAAAVGGPWAGLGAPVPVLPQEEAAGGGYGLPEQPQYERVPGIHTPPFMPQPNMTPYQRPALHPRNTKQLALTALATAFVGRKERKRKKKAYEWEKQTGAEEQKVKENLAEIKRVEAWNAAETERYAREFEEVKFKTKTALDRAAERRLVTAAEQKAYNDRIDQGEDLAKQGQFKRDASLPDNVNDALEAWSKAAAQDLEVRRAGERAKVETEEQRAEELHRKNVGAWGRIYEDSLAQYGVPYDELGHDAKMRLLEEHLQATAKWIKTAPDRIAKRRAQEDQRLLTRARTQLVGQQIQNARTAGRRAQVELKNIMEGRPPVPSAAGGGSQLSGVPKPTDSQVAAAYRTLTGYWTNFRPIGAKRASELRTGTAKPGYFETGVSPETLTFYTLPETERSSRTLAAREAEMVLLLAGRGSPGRLELPLDEYQQRKESFLVWLPPEKRAKAAQQFDKHFYVGR